MDALQFLDEPQKNVDALQFLDAPSEKLSAEDFLSERGFKEKALEFLTMGHIEGEYGPEREVYFTPEGEMVRAEVPTGDPSFFQDPITALAMGGVAGAKAAGGLVGKGIAAGREALGWITGGGSEVPTLAKAGAKGVAKAVSAKPLAEAATKRQSKGVLESVTPEAKISAEAVTETTGKAAPKTATSAEAFLTGKEPSPPEIVQPGAHFGGMPDDLSYAKYVLENNVFSKTDLPYYLGKEAKQSPHGIAPDIWKQASDEIGFHESNLVKTSDGKFYLKKLAPMEEISYRGPLETADAAPQTQEIARGVLSKKDMTPTGGLDLLAKEQAATKQAGKVGFDISKKEPQPTYTFAEPETEKLFQSAKGTKPESIATKIKAVATEIGHKFTRDFEPLANKKENAQLIFDLKRLEKQKDVVADRTTRSIGETLSGLNKAEYDLFNRKVVLDDLISDYNRGLYASEKELPFKFKPESLTAEKGKLDALIQTNPKLVQALEKRTAMWDQVKAEYIEALSPYKPGVEDMFRENYYRHQVLDYVATNGIFGTGKRLRTPQKGYMKGRSGASNLYNTDYLEAEHQIMAQMLHDAETAKTLTKIKTGEDISAQIRAQAKAKGIDDWHKEIPEGYTTWQPKEGSVFHPVLTVDEKTAEKIMAGEIEEILGSGKDIFKEALAVGGKRKEWVVRQEVADTLNNLVRERAKGVVSAVDLNVMSAWKKWQLIQPRRYFKYNIRNLTGDAEATFLGNASGFKKIPQAVRELGNVFFGKKPMTEDMAKWFERGGMSSTLQAQEMDALKPMWMFSRLYEQKGGALTPWKKYWEIARLTTDFRESILRYANYLDFKEQLLRNGGKPLKYGASKPEMIDGLKDIDDKAFWLSNDLLGAYDRVSVAGQTIRERAIPFWSWQEVNFKRYIQLFRNAANDGEVATAIGKKLGTSTVIAARKVGSLAIKMSAFASALAVYNHTMFPEEEKQLPLDVRTKPHIILGRDEKGDIQYFNRMGTLDDFISWFGMDYTPRIVGQYLNGDKTWKETLQEQAKETMHAPVNKVIGGAVPFTKLAGELISRKSAFPDIFQAGTIRDRYLHIARSFGLENEYIAMAGKPSRGYGQSLINTFIYTVNPGEAAYRTVFDLKNDFLKKLGKTSEGFWLTPTGDALYNMKLSMKYGDKQAFTKYFTEYISLAQQQGRTPEQIRQGMKSAIKSMDPLNGLNDQMKAAFINGLNKDNQDALLQAYQFYKDVLSGGVQ